jgi:putative transposase
MPATDPSLQRLQLIEQLLRLPVARLDEVERFLAALPPDEEAPRASTSGAVLVQERDWPHAPLHRISPEGTYMVTASTLGKTHIFRGAERLEYLEGQLLSQAKQAGWQLEAWAVFSNHYHFVGHARRGSTLLNELLQELHRSTSLHVNKLDQAAGRQTWFQYRETALTYETSYIARLSYVHQNAVKHGLVPVASQYRWCSAAWFERTATAAQLKTIYRQKIDRIRVEDDFEPV